MTITILTWEEKLAIRGYASSIYYSTKNEIGSARINFGFAGWEVRITLTGSNHCDLVGTAYPTQAEAEKAAASYLTGRQY